MKVCRQVFKHKRKAVLFVLEPLAQAPGGCSVTERRGVCTGSHAAACAGSPGKGAKMTPGCLQMMGSTLSAHQLPSLSISEKLSFDEIRLLRCHNTMIISLPVISSMPSINRNKISIHEKLHPKSAVQHPRHHLAPLCALDSTHQSSGCS